MLNTFEQTARALADPIRLRILKLLEEGELCACHLSAVLALDADTVDHALAVLRHAGLVQAHHDGDWTYYRLAKSAVTPYGPAFLALLKGRLNDDDIVADDRCQLARLHATPPPLLSASEHAPTWSGAGEPAAE